MRTLVLSSFLGLLLAVSIVAPSTTEAWPDRTLSESQECEDLSGGALGRARRWFRRWFGKPAPPCDAEEGIDHLLSRFFSMSTWLASSKREELLAELPTHEEFKQGGSKDKIVDYMTRRFPDIMGRLGEEVKDKIGIDVTPLASFLDDSAWPESELERDSALPVVVVPGVNSHCEGLVSRVVKFLRHYLNTEHVECIAEGSTAKDQIISSIFSGGEDIVEHFRQRVLANPVYAERGFNIIAFSQGNFVTRAYVQQYSGMTIDNQVHPTVKNWVAMNGPVFGQGGIPVVDTSTRLGVVLNGIATVACRNEFLASVVTPCAYLRVPGGTLGSYRSRLVAKLNGEDVWLLSAAADREAQEHFLAQSKENINRLESFVAVKNLGDTVIKPREAQWLGTYGSSFEEVLEFQETPFYQEDTFGFKTLHAEGKVHFVETPGELEHCIFSTQDLRSWIDDFWVPSLGRRG